MYSESDIEAAIASGAITPEAAAALRDSVASGRATPAVDEESFRLLTGFNDIFVTIAAILMLVAVGWIGFTLSTSIWPLAEGDSKRIEGLSVAFLFSGTCVAATSWMLAEYFTRRRRMALPSIVLLGGFVYATGWALYGLLMTIFRAPGERGLFAILAVATLATAGAAWIHWRRFRVPITIAALTGALVATLLALLLFAVPAAKDALLWLALAAGLAVFAFAMWWDMSDRDRVTRRSDVAFWLHLGAAPLIAHPVFQLMGVLDGDVSPLKGVMVLVLYVLFGLVALAVDRRALLVSSLVYVLYALSSLFKQFGAISLNMAFTALLIGGTLLLLSAFWHPLRRKVVVMLPDKVQARLPALDRAVVVKA
ncbi:hypothetical protein PQ455_05665 [Sphingomonas naphthae]|uniref:DUF2157 domain-containing protein n=1 Tax=Sphingomonas naphthae TaxID=1813468 RepID=A0ABY7TR95_9SPHN|nr:hypothetical protein [Sphingomonas naphthae]WCT74714.1 hypothetical protein PQ455_05665 [Sphingomonas naphthae]